MRDTPRPDPTREPLGTPAELATEHERLLELAVALDIALYEGTDATAVFDEFHRWLADGPTGPHVPKALLLLATHIDDEEHDLFPDTIHALDPEQCDEIELAHRAVEAVWNEPDGSREAS
jgi:hypothetical protein